jgi:hypothetical protein
MLNRYGHMSRTDGGQPLDLQAEAIWEADVTADHVYGDRMSRRHDPRPGLNRAGAR